jgi:hypothetical protein
MGVGCLLVSKLGEVGDGEGEEARLCIVRSAGLGLARLARWEV